MDKRRRMSASAWACVFARFFTGHCEISGNQRLATFDALFVRAVPPRIMGVLFDGGAGSLPRLQCDSRNWCACGPLTGNSSSRPLTLTSSVPRKLR